MKKMTILTMFLVAICSLTLLSGCGRSGYQVTKSTGPYIVTLKINHNPPIAGPNDVTVNIKDQSNNDVTDAKVIVKYAMPAMPGMPAMRHKTDTVLKNNTYQGQIDLMMAGSWNLSININRAGKTQTVRFSIDAR